MNVFRKKLVIEHASGLERCLSALDLTLLGIGAIVGAGIFVFTGHAAAHYAGPAIVLSFIVSGLACAFAALAYAELASTFGGCGSAYGYAYAGIGELVAWIIGWDLILEYGVSIPSVAIGWSGYVANALTALGIPLPTSLVHGPWETNAPGILNFPAMAIIVLLAGLLSIGVRVSAQVNTVMVFVKLLTITVFIALAVGNVNLENWTPFMPNGWSGVTQGAAVVFFAYIGFDAVSTAAEETKNPSRDLPIGIIGSLAICTVIYIVVAALLTGIVPYQTLASPSPVADALLRIGYRWGSAMIATGAIAGLTTVMLVLYYGLTRIFLAMARDGLLPQMFAVIHPRSRTPVRVILVVGVLMALIAGFAPVERIIELVNIGTLAAFALVCTGVIILRRTQPDLPRPFRTPGNPVIPALGIAFCLYLMFSLPIMTWERFVVWLVIGLVVYFNYSRQHSTLATSGTSAGPR